MHMLAASPHCSKPVLPQSGNLITSDAVLWGEAGLLSKSRTRQQYVVQLQVAVDDHGRPVVQPLQTLRDLDAPLDALLVRVDHLCRHGRER